MSRALNERRGALRGLGVAFVAVVPAVGVRLAGGGLPHPVEAVVYGVGIIGAAFLLAWAAEVAQLEISARLALAILAFVAVLPEYAVDLVFAIKGGHGYERFGAACQSAAERAAGTDSSCSLALANMTGANRLLIGVGWSVVVFVSAWRLRAAGRPAREVRLGRAFSVELSYLLLATIYSLTLPFRKSITLLDAVVLVAIFIAYTIRIAGAPPHAPELVGPARWLGALQRRRRRQWTVGLFLFSATVILLIAEPFAEALVETGKRFGVSEFLLVQWLAPLASEAPELIVAILYAWRLKTENGLGTLVSSKVNQWTLLVGTLPIAFAFASVSSAGLPIDAAQRQELFLTAAQSLFAIAVLASLTVTVVEAGVLFGLFWGQFLLGAVIPESAHGAERIAVAIIYVVLAAGLFVRDRRRLGPLVRDGFRASHKELAAERGGDRG